MREASFSRNSIGAARIDQSTIFEQDLDRPRDDIIGLYRFFILGISGTIGGTVIDLVPVPDSTFVERLPEVDPLLRFGLDLFRGDLCPFRGKAAPHHLAPFPAYLPGDASIAAVFH